jgi:hypothetical protein
MIGFFFKKAFFDGWDNLFGIAALNVVHLVLAALFVVLPLSLGVSTAVTVIFFVIGVLLDSIWQAGCAELANGIADYHSIGFKAALDAAGRAVVPGLQKGLVNLILIFSIMYGFPFYLSTKGYLGIFAAGLLFWSVIIALLIFQYYLSLRYRFGGGFIANVKKAAIVFLDNPGFSIFLLFYNFVTAIISLLPAFLAPGLAGIALANADAVKLRLMKYDWIEKNPGADRKHVPWDELLVEERELVGKRTLKGMIFPWKEEK